jgi:hypothetical protein
MMLSLSGRSFWTFDTFFGLFEHVGLLLFPAFLGSSI